MDLISTTEVNRNISLSSDSSKNITVVTETSVNQKVTVDG